MKAAVSRQERSRARFTIAIHFKLSSENGGESAAHAPRSPAAQSVTSDYL